MPRDLPIRVVRDADAARLGHAFQPRGDVDAVAEDVVALDDDVAEIDADAELDAAVLRHIGVALGHAALHLDRAAHRVDDAGELDQHAVAGGLDDAAAVLGDLGIDKLAAQAFSRSSVPSSSAPISGYSPRHRPRGRPQERPRAGARHACWTWRTLSLG